MSDMRIGGLASGMDIDQIVSDLMKIENIKRDRLEQDKQVLQWRQEAYNDLNKYYANFILDTKKDFGLSSTTSTGTLINVSVSSLDWVKSATSSDTTIATVSSLASSSEGTYNITVDKIAKNFSAASSGSISDGATTDLATQFTDIASTDTIQFTIETNSGSQLFTYSGGLDSVSLDDIVKDINDANLGVTASFDSSIDRFFIQTDDTGTTNTLKITDTSTIAAAPAKKFFTGANNLLKLQQDEDGDSTYTDFEDGTIKTYAGQDAQIDFGAAVNITQASNNFTINGIELSLKNTGSFTVTIGTDVDAVYDKINSFVESYNEMVGKVYGELREETYRDYLPLTDEQKESMTEDEIELWEEKAKSGLLRNDLLLERTMQTVRNGLYEEVSSITGAYDQLTEIGITTEAYSSGSVGKLVIDEEDLRDAIQNNADDVLELLFKQPSESLRSKSEDSMTAAEITQKREESGLINRMYDNLIAGMKDVINKAGPGDDSSLLRNVQSSILLDFVTEHGSISMLDSDIDDINSDINTMIDRLSSIENRYWKQFSAMEQAINQMNQQSAWIGQQMVGM